MSDDHWYPVSILCDDTTVRLSQILQWLTAEGLGGAGRQTVLERERASWPPRPLRLVLGFRDPATAVAVKMRWG